MRVDAAGQDEHRLCVDHAIGMDRQVRPDHLDPFAVHQNIGAVIVGGGDDTTIANQNEGHAASGISRDRYHPQGYAKSPSESTRRVLRGGASEFWTRAVETAAL